MVRTFSGWPRRKTGPVALSTNTRSPVFWKMRPPAPTKNDRPRPKTTAAPPVGPPPDPPKTALADLRALLMTKYPPSRARLMSAAEAAPAPRSASSASVAVARSAPRLIG